MQSTNRVSSYLSPIIAHRGASSLAPENTLAAFRKAQEIGAKWVEFDVMLASCGEAIVFHDETLERTTNGHGNVWDYPYSYLQTLDAGSWFNPIYSGERIPRLQEVIEELHRLKLAANIEIKPIRNQEEETVKKTLNVIEQHWRKDMKPPLISSFSRTVLEWVRKYSKTHFLGFLMNEWQMDWEKSCDELNCVSVNMNHKIINQSRVNEIKLTNRLILSYTVDDSDIAQHLYELGVDSIFSNCPANMGSFF